MSATATQPQQHEQKKKQSESAGEEALKKNTDCVYFLASPSTCKKVFGSYPVSASIRVLDSRSRHLILCLLRLGF